MNTNFSVLRLTSILLASAFAVAAADSKPTLKLVAEGFVSPTVFVPIDNGRALIADQLGKIHVLGKDGKLSDKVAIDLGPKLSKYNTNAFDERGICGLAVHPKFVENRKIYVYYSAPLRQGGAENFDHTSRLSEFTLAKDDTAGSERLLLEVDAPYFNHNGGRMAFGPDGLLYIAVGDGGNAHDIDAAPRNGVQIRGKAPEGNGQSRKTFMGKLLRIDVDKKDAGKEYAVPKDNPFVSGGTLPEIYALGFRNPWGLSFDRGGSRELYLADVGQDSYEELNIITKGGNYGWNIREGFACFDPKKPKNPPEDCPKVGAAGEPLIDPILSYKSLRKFPKDPEAKGISVTGGFIYRGKALPQFTGKYIFADWSRNFVIPDGLMYVASKGSDGKWSMESLDLASHAGGVMKQFVLAFGEDADGELYVLTNTSSALRGNTGKVWKLVPSN